MRALVIVSAFVASGLAACQPFASANRPVSIESMLACQQAARARGFPEVDWEIRDVAADPAPAGVVSVKGKLVRGAGNEDLQLRLRRFRCPGQRHRPVGRSQSVFGTKRLQAHARTVPGWRAVIRRFGLAIKI